MNSSGIGIRQQAVTDIYTDLQGMQQLGQEKDKSVALKKVAQQFESMFVQMMLKNMRQANAVFEKDSMMNSEETNFYRDMYDNQLSLTLSHGRGIGIADAMYAQMTHQFGIRESSAAEQSLKDNIRTSISRDETIHKITRDQDSSFRVPTNGSADFIFEGQNLGKNSLDKADEKIISENEKVSSLSNDISRVMLAQSPQEFIERLKPLAAKAAKALGIDENMLLAQSALETGWGSKVVANNDGESSNNVFNIKQGRGWNGHVAHRDTIEIDNGVAKLEKANFRSYETLADSFNDYVQFIQQNERYSSALKSGANPQSYIEKIHSAGYATDPDYADKVKAVYDRILKLRENESVLSTSHQEVKNTLVNSSIDYSS